MINIQYVLDLIKDRNFLPIQALITDVLNTDIDQQNWILVSVREQLTENQDKLFFEAIVDQCNFNFCPTEETLAEIMLKSN